MYSKNPPWFHLLNTLDPSWEHWSFNITNFARNSERIPSGWALGKKKTPGWLFRKLMRKMEHHYFSCILPLPLLLQCNVCFAWKTLIIKIAVMDFSFLFSYRMYAVSVPGQELILCMSTQLQLLVLCYVEIRKSNKAMNNVIFIYA